MKTYYRELAGRLADMAHRVEESRAELVAAIGIKKAERPPGRTIDAFASQTARNTKAGTPRISRLAGRDRVFRVEKATSSLGLVCCFAGQGRLPLSQGCRKERAAAVRVWASSLA